jgi:hypothetical protein
MAIPYTSSYDETIAFSDVAEQFNLAQNTAQTYTVPGNSTQYFSVLFGKASNTNIFVGKNNTAASPGGGSKTALQYVEFINPGEKRYVVGGDVLSFITPDAAGAYMGISVRSIPS